MRPLHRLILHKAPSSPQVPGRLMARYNSNIFPVEKAPPFLYQPIEGVERLERYQPGGYYPALIGDMFKDRYRIVHKLGHGTYSTVWLARDEQQAVYVAVKIGTGDSPSSEADVLCAITDTCQTDCSGRAMIPLIHDRFEIQSPNGSHKCYVTPPAQSSVAAASFSSFFDLDTARALASELVLAIAYTHARGFVHGDVHLGNVLIRLPSSLNKLTVEQLYGAFGEPCTEQIERLDGQPLPPGVPRYGTVPVWLGKKSNEIALNEAHLLLSDFGEAFSPSNPQQTRTGEQCCLPLPVLPPEAYFEPDRPISFPADIWALACAIWSIFSSRPLFDATLATHDDISSQQVDILGQLPLKWWKRWEARHEYFDSTGRPKKSRFIVPSLEDCFEREIQAPRQRDGMGQVGTEETVALLDMLRRMLAFRPEERATATTIFDSKWMTTWGLPAFKKTGMPVSSERGARDCIPSTAHKKQNPRTIDWVQMN